MKPLSLPDHVRWTMLCDEIIVLHHPQGRSYHFNNVGAIIWSKLLEGHDPEGVVNYLTREFGVPLDRAHQDVETFFLRLSSADLISLPGRI